MTLLIKLEEIIDLAVFVIIIVEPFFLLASFKAALSKLVIEWPEQNKLEANSKIPASGTTIGITNTTWFKMTGFIRVIY